MIIFNNQKLDLQGTTKLQNQILQSSDKQLDRFKIMQREQNKASDKINTQQQCQDQSMNTVKEGKKGKNNYVVKLIKLATNKSPQNQITEPIKEVMTAVKRTKQAAVKYDKLCQEKL